MQVNQFKAIRYQVSRDGVTIQFSPPPYGTGHEDFFLLWSHGGGFLSMGEIAYTLRQLNCNLTVLQSEKLATKIQDRHSQFLGGYPVCSN